MKKWTDYGRKFIQNRGYLILLVLSAIGAYGYKVTHLSIGIDDTPYAYYFEDGLIAIVGRWVLYLLNKVLRIGDFAPFFTDFVAVLLLIGAAVVWTVLFYSVLGERIPRCGYAFFAAIFLTCPLISEVFTYFLHNGIAIGYLASGLSLCFYREAQGRMKKGTSKPGTGRVARSLSCLLVSALLLFVAIGCYESFMIVWLVGLVLLLLTERFAGSGERVFLSLFGGALTALAAFLLRSMMIALVTRIFGLQALQGEAVQRSVTEMLSWMTQEGALAEFAMILKRTLVMYGVFGYAYLPIAVFVGAVAVLLVGSLVHTIAHRDAWSILLALGSLLAAFLLEPIEGAVTLYRTAQFLPLICGYGILLLFYGLHASTEAGSHLGRRLLATGKGALRVKMAAWVRGLACVGCACLLFNQCADMNRWFYLDVCKYEAAVEEMQQIAYDLERDYDTSKPVIFCGTYSIPQSIVQDAYVAYGSETYGRMKRLCDLIDPNLLDKFNRSYGVWVAQTPSLSVLDWGRYAFDDDTELVRFFAMHGHTLTACTDTSLYADAEAYAEANMPSYPQDGYIQDMGDYLIVHF